MCKPSTTDGALTIFGLADLPLSSVIELLSGLFLLIAGAELMVRAAVRLAARLGMLRSGTARVRVQALDD